MPNFRLVPLAYEPFAPLFSLDDATLATRGIVRERAARDVGWPCRVSLRDALAGEEVLLLPYTHQPADSPYHASGPIFVRRGAEPATLAPGELPDYVTRRVISLRAYDARDMMVAAEVRDGALVAAEIAQMFADPAVRYLHLHNAKPGCFSCRVERVSDSSGVED